MAKNKEDNTQLASHGDGLPQPRFVLSTSISYCGCETNTRENIPRLVLAHSDPSDSVWLAPYTKKTPSYPFLTVDSGAGPLYRGLEI